MDYKTSSWVVLFLRSILGFMFIAAGFAFLTQIKFYITDPNKILPWFPQSYPGLLQQTWAILILILGIFILMGIYTRYASLSICFILLVIHSFWMASNPFQNTLSHTVPFLIIAMTIFYFSQKGNHYSLDNYFHLNTTELSSDIVFSFLTLFVRLMVGIIFLAQTHRGLFVRGPLWWTENNYVGLFASTWLPTFLLWAVGIINLFIEFLGGIAFIIGFRTRLTAIVLSFFLVTIVFGHMHMDPYETNAIEGITSYGLNNFAFVLMALIFSSKADNFSLDYFLKTKFKMEE